MEPETVLQKIRQILIINFDWLTGVNDIYPDHKLRDDLKLDSIAMVNLQVSVEDEFDIRFDPIESDLAKVFETVLSLAEYIEKISQEQLLSLQ